MTDLVDGLSGVEIVLYWEAQPSHIFEDCASTDIEFPLALGHERPDSRKERGERVEGYFLQHSELPKQKWLFRGKAKESVLLGRIRQECL